MVRVLPLLVAFVVSACSSNGTVTATSAEPTATPAAASPAAQEAVQPIPAELPDVIASVNGETISRADFESAVANLEANAGAAVPAGDRDRIYRQVLDQLIGYRLLIQETRARKLTAPNGDIDGRLAQFRAQFPSDEVFQQVLEQQGMTLEQLRANALNDVLVEQLFQAEVEPTISVTPEQMEAFYKDNPDQFRQAERVRASHILFSVPQDADAAAKQLARTRATTVLQEIRGGKDFAELAKLHSQDPGSAANGGDLGFFEAGQMVPPFEKAAFALQPGQTSELVESDFGVHIIRVVDRQAARTLPLDEIRPQLQDFLAEQQRRERIEAFVGQLKAKGKVEIFI